MQQPPRVGRPAFRGDGKEFILPLLQAPLNRFFVPRPSLRTFRRAPYRVNCPQKTGPILSSIEPYHMEALDKAAQEYQPAVIEGRARSLTGLRIPRGLQKPATKSSESRGEEIQRWRQQELASTEGKTGNPYETLFVGRLAYSVTEDDLRKEFERYGRIVDVKVVRQRQPRSDESQIEGQQPVGKSRGYAFIQFERERDLQAAYRGADGIKINGRRIVVDVERGRTAASWKPARLGGGLGGSSRKGLKPVPMASGRDPLADRLLHETSKPSTVNPAINGDRNRKRSRSPDSANVTYDREYRTGSRSDSSSRIVYEEGEMAASPPRDYSSSRRDDRRAPSYDYRR